MANNDYHVIVYKVLKYLYECLKSGNKPSLEYLSCGSRDFPVESEYWTYIIRNLYENGFVTGVRETTVLGKGRVYDMDVSVEITPKGIEYVLENSTMAKAKKFLQETKQTLPWL